MEELPPKEIAEQGYLGQSVAWLRDYVRKNNILHGAVVLSLSKAKLVEAIINKEYGIVAPADTELAINYDKFADIPDEPVYVAPIQTVKASSRLALKMNLELDLNDESLILEAIDFLNGVLAQRHGYAAEQVEHPLENELLAQEQATAFESNYVEEPKNGSIGGIYEQ
jgi:hypothetical protein